MIEITNFCCRLFIFIVLIGTPIQMLWIFIVKRNNMRVFIKNYFILHMLEWVINHTIKIFFIPIRIALKFRHKILVTNRINRALNTPKGFTNEANYLINSYIFARILNPHMIIEHILLPATMKNIKNNSNFFKELTPNNPYEAYHTLAFSTSNIEASLMTNDKFYAKIDEAKFLLSLLLLKFEGNDLHIILEKINDYGAGAIINTFKNNSNVLKGQPLFYRDALNLKALEYYKYFYRYLIKSQSLNHFVATVDVYNHLINEYLNDKNNGGAKFVYTLDDYFIEPFPVVCKKVNETLTPIVEKYAMDDSVPIEWLLELEKS